MQVPLQLSFHNVRHSNAIEDLVRRKAVSLERFFDRITACRVAVAAPHHKHHKGNQFHIRIEVSVPGEKIVISRDPGPKQTHEDMYAAVRDAFRAATRQLEATTASRRQRTRISDVMTA